MSLISDTSIVITCAPSKIIGTINNCSILFPIFCVCKFSTGVVYQVFITCWQNPATAHFGGSGGIRTHVPFSERTP